MASDQKSVDTESSDEEVVEFSKDQRLAGPEEPTCIVCGRYGAYICDATDQDVCSLECKAAHLASQRESSSIKEQPEALEASVSSGNSLAGNIEQLISNSKLRDNIAAGGYSKFLPDQLHVMATVLAQSDVAIGTRLDNRSLVCLIAVVEYMQRTRRSISCRHDCSTPSVLVMVASPYLGTKVEDIAKRLMTGLPNMRTALVVGGPPLPNQVHRLKSAVQLVVATPERLEDVLINHPSCLDLSCVGMLLVEELGGFTTAPQLQQQLLRMASQLPADRQAVMTHSGPFEVVSELANRLSTGDIISICTAQDTDVHSTGPCHTVVWVEESNKKKKLFSLLCDGRSMRQPTVVYVNSKMGSVLLAEAIHKELDHHVMGLHGNMTSDKRTSVVRSFVDGTLQVLVTSVPLTGQLHCHQIVFFDLPSSVELFNEMVGVVATSVTTRGQVTSFVNSTNQSLFSELVELFGSLGVRLPKQLLEFSTKITSKAGRHKKKRQNDSVDLKMQTSLERLIKRSKTHCED